jgi:hypothetical protein
MEQTKLILVEGIMGSGKTSTANFMADTHRKWDQATELYLEGNLDHPADYEAVSCMDREMGNALLMHDPDFETILKQYATLEGNDLLIQYGKLGKQIPTSLYDEIQKYDIYDGISLAKHRELLLSRWEHFVEQQAQREVTTIFECCFMQNPMCAFLAKHNAGQEAVVEHILKLAEQIQPLNPLLIYFHQRDIRETVERVSQERSKEWLDFVIRYHTEHEYGKAHDLQGFDGLIQFLQMRQEIELEICKRLPFETLVIDNSDHDWNSVLHRLEQKLRSRFV